MPNKIEVAPATIEKDEPAIISVEKILKIQVEYVFNNKLIWSILAYAQVILFFTTMNLQASFIWPIVEACLIPDVDPDTGLTRKHTQLHYTKLAPGEENQCLWLPQGGRPDKALRLTYFQFVMVDLPLGNSAIFWLISAGYIFCYLIDHPFFEQYKIQSDKPWPWKSEKKEEWSRLYWHSIRQYIFNSFVINPLVGLTFGYLLNWRMPWKFKAEEMPPNWMVFIQFVFCFLIEDFLFYTFHRLFHIKDKRLPLYQWIHKQHHVHKQPFILASQDAHPIEQFCANVFPSMLAPTLLGNSFHAYGMFGWGFCRLLHNIEGHSGYEFPWSIFRNLPFFSNAQFHDFHHSANVGNYASTLNFWDTIFDTNTEFWEEYGDEYSFKPVLKQKQE